jgi:hypothetical protein
LVAETTLQLTGWVSLPEVKAKSETRNPEEQKDKNGSPRSPVSFRLLPLRVGPTQSLTTFVRLEGDKDLALEPANLRNLLPLPSSVVSNKELSFVTDQGDYSGEVFLRPAPSTSEAKVLTFLEAIDRQLSFRSDIDLSVPAGEKRRFTISLRNWQGEAHFEGHEVQVRPAPSSTLPRPGGEGREGGERRWSLDLQADSTGPVLVRLKGRAQLNLPKSSLPDVRVEGEIRQQRWFAVGPDLRGENPQGLLALTDSNSLVTWWPSQKDPLRQASSIWEIREPNWNLRLSPRAGVPAPAVQVLLADQQAAVLDGTHWEYHANYWLSHRPGNGLTIRFPTNAKILEVTVDGTEISPLPLAAPRWWVPLAGSRAGQVLKLRWIYENAHSQLDRPILESPRLEGLPEFPATWTVHVPPGFAVERPQASAQEITAGAKFLRAAEAQLQLSLLLAKHDFGNDRPEFSSHFKAAQERFYRYCRLAEHWLTLTNGSDAVLQEIRQRNRKQATTQGFEKIRQRAEEQARLDPLDLGGINDQQAFSVHGGLLTGQGTPTYWLVPTGAPAPQLHLTTRWQRKIEAATKASSLVAVILLVVVVVSCIPKARGLVKAVGPEMMILLGCLGWWRATPDWSFVVLIILGLFARLLFLIRKWATLPAPARRDPDSAIKRGDQSMQPSVAGSS